MPAKTTKSALSSKLGNRLNKAVNAHKNDDTRLTGGADLPPGIEGGIAQLVECKFSTYEKGDQKGEFFFYAAGSVIAPSEVAGIPLVGLRTSIMEPVCDTPTRSRKTIEDHVDWVLNEFRKLGVDTKGMTGDDLEGTAAALKEAGPSFRFRTWQGEATEEYPNPRVNHDWRGSCDYEGADPDAGVVDDTQTGNGKATEEMPWEADDDTPAEEPTSEDDLMSIGLKADEGDEDAQTDLYERARLVGVDADEMATWVEVVAAIEESSTTVAEPSGEVDLDALGAAADNDDEDAQVELETLAEAAGIDSNLYPTWTEVAELLKDGGEATAEVDEDWEPAVTEIYPYTPPRAKTAVECEVTHVFPGKKVVNLKSLEGNKSYKAVAWSALER